MSCAMEMFEGEIEFNRRLNGEAAVKVSSKTVLEVGGARKEEVLRVEEEQDRIEEGNIGRQWRNGKI